MDNKTIFIWGCNAFSEQLCEILKNSRCKILGFVEKNRKDDFCKLPVYAPTEIKNNPEYLSIPIVVASPHVMSAGLPGIDFESIYQFKKLLQEISCEHQIKNHLLHASALIDMVDLDFSNKIVSFGLPGSGNVVFSRICEAIVAEFQTEFLTRDKKSLFFERVCFEYQHIIQQVMPDFLHAQQGTGFNMATWKFGTSHAFCPIEDDTITIFTLQTRNYVIGPVCNYHSVPSKESLEKLQRQKFKLFFNIRNPLDVILSCINKYGCIDPATKQINMKNFGINCHRLVGLYTKWLPFYSYLNILSYDLLIQNPEHEIESLMKYLNLKPTKGAAKKIWDNLGFKTLNAAPKDHFWKGGSNKWEEYFKDEHLSFLKEMTNIEEILERYHYQEVLERFRERTRHISTALWQKNCSGDEIEAMSQKSYELYGNENDDTLQYLQRYYGDDKCIKTSDLIVAGNNLSIVKRIHEMLDNRYLNQIVSAGSLREYRVV